MTATKHTRPVPRATPAAAAPEVFVNRKLSWHSSLQMPWDGWERFDGEDGEEGDDGIAVMHHLTAEARIEEKFDGVDVSFTRRFWRMWRGDPHPRPDGDAFETADLSFVSRECWSQFVEVVNRMDAEIRPLLDRPVPRHSETETKFSGIPQ